MVDIVPMQQWWHLEHSIQLARNCLDRDRIKSIRQELLHADATYYVALVHGGVKGFAGFKKTGINCGIYEFPWCVVHPEYRGQGIGTLLTAQRIQDVRELDGSAILLTTPYPKIYHRHGFETIALVPRTWAGHLMMRRFD